MQAMPLIPQATLYTVSEVGLTRWRLLNAAAKAVPGLGLSCPRESHAFTITQHRAARIGVDDLHSEMRQHAHARVHQSIPNKFIHRFSKIQNILYFLLCKCQGSCCLHGMCIMMIIGSTPVHLETAPPEQGCRSHQSDWPHPFSAPQHQRGWPSMASQRSSPAWQQPRISRHIISCTAFNSFLEQLHLG